MEYKVQKLEKNKAKVTISLNEQEWQNEILAAYNKHKGRYQVEGFRAGKAPKKVIEKLYGEQVFYEDALSESFSKYYYEVLDKEADLNPIDAPHLNIVKVNPTELVVEAKVELQPEIVIKKYTGFGVKVEPKKVTDADVEAELNKLLTQHTRFVESNEPVKNGDLVNLDFSGSIDGKKFDGGTAKGYDLEIGSKSFIDTFEDQLVGLTVGSEKDVVVTFPKDYQAKDLAGKQAVFHVLINTIKVKQVPTLNDSFIADVTEFENIADYKADLLKHLNEQAVKNAENKRNDEILNKVLENTEVELPKSMVDHELEHDLEHIEMQLMYQGVTLDGYLEYMNITKKQFTDSRRTIAEKSVKLSLAMQHIVQKENLSLTQADIDHEIETMAKAANKPLAEYVKQVDDHVLGHIKNDVLMKKVMEFLLKNN